MFLFCFSDPHPSDNQKKQLGPHPLKNKPEQQQQQQQQNLKQKR